MKDFMIHCCKILCVFLISGSLSITAKAQQYSITVSTGGFDRIETVVSFPFPDIIQQGVYQLSSSSGNYIPLQVDSSGIGWFILDSLRAGSSRTYSFSTESAPEAEPEKRVRHTIDENTISFQTGTNNVLSYFYRDNSPPESLDDRYKRGGYIHPVYSPNGVELTSHLNIDHHPHHLGIWSAWTNTEYQGRTPDFWNFHDNTGNVEVADSLADKWEGPVHAGFKNHHLFIDHSAPEPVVALNEEWEARVYPASKSGDYLMFDLVITQTANTGKPLHLPEYHYGGLGVRGHANWDDPDNVSFLTSGGSGREGDATRVRWSHIGGLVDDHLAGLTMMGHPDNYRHPQPIRIHPDIPYFNFAPTQLGEMSIKPGSPYITRYRFVTYDGEPDADELDRLWNDYAYPPGVTVQNKSPLTRGD